MKLIIVKIYLFVHRNSKNGSQYIGQEIKGQKEKQ
jgi:hypothetical protein